MNAVAFGTMKFLILWTLWIVGSLTIGVSHFWFAAVQVVWGVQFVRYRSTKVALDLRDKSSAKIVHLSYGDYDRWAQQVANVDASVFDSTDVHWTEKLGILKAISEAKTHVLQPAPSIVRMLCAALPICAFLFFPEVQTHLQAMPPKQLLITEVMSGLVVAHLSGSASGRFYRWLRGRMSQ